MAMRCLARNLLGRSLLLSKEVKPPPANVNNGVIFEHGYFFVRTSSGNNIRKHGLSTNVNVKPDSEEKVPDAELEPETPSEIEKTKLVVLGGNGFVGSAICKEAVSRGISVISLNRSGAPGGGQPWADKVEWVRGDVLETSRWKHILSEATAVVSCVGAFGSNEFMLKMNGEANAGAAKVAAEEGVNRFVYISAHDVGLPGFVLKGYYDGKRIAEEAVREFFPYGGVILRPAMIHGTRQIGNFSLPLSLVGAPLEMALKNVKWANSIPLIGPALAPPVKVTAVAKTAVRGATENSFPPGVVDVWGILRFGDH